MLLHITQPHPQTAASAAAERAVIVFTQHRPQQRIAQQHPFRLAPSSHQQRPQQGIAQQPHTSIIRGRVLSSNILTQQHPQQGNAQQHPCMQKIRGPKSGPLNCAATSSHQYCPQHGIPQHHPRTSTVRTVRSTVSRSTILVRPVRSTVSRSTILTPARYRAAPSSHQHRPHSPQHGIAQHHPHTSSVRSVRSTVSRSNILTPAPSAARYRAAPSSHQQRPQRPQHGIAQQHPHTSTVRTVRSTVSRSNILTSTVQPVRSTVSRSTILTPAPSTPSAARYRAAPSSHQHRPPRPQHGIAQHLPHTSTVGTVRSTVSRSNILTHQHRPTRPQHSIAQQHPHTSTVRTVRTTVSRSDILTPSPSAPSAARYRAAPSSHQHRPQLGYHVSVG